jgi:APA family basic amino acid/polyamine antiporter
VFFPVLNDVFLKTSIVTISYGQLVAIASIIALTMLNSRGVQNGKILQLIFTSAKLFALFALIVLGLAIGLKSDVFTQNFDHMWNAYKTVQLPSGELDVIPLSGFALMGALGATIINSLFSSDAWNNVTFIAGEIKDPKKNIPKSLFFGTTIVTIIYILANLAYLALLPKGGDPMATDALGQGIMFAANDRVGAGAASVIFGGLGITMMAALIMISTFGCNNGLILAGSRLFYAMSSDGLFFKQAKKLNQFNVPSVAMWIQGIWASILCLSGKYGDLLVYSTFASLLFYILTIFGIFILRKKEPNTERPYKAFGYPFIPALYILVTLAICVDLLVYDLRNAGMGLLIVLLGIPIYFIADRKKR